MAESLTSKRLFCVGREPASPPAPVQPPADSTEVDGAAAADADDATDAEYPDQTSESGAAAADIDDRNSADSDDRNSADSDGDAPPAEPSAAVYTAPCGALAEPVISETARMTLSLPAMSVETLLDDWLSRVAASNLHELSRLRHALSASQAASDASREQLSAEVPPASRSARAAQPAPRVM